MSNRSTDVDDAARPDPGPPEPYARAFADTLQDDVAGGGLLGAPPPTTAARPARKRSDLAGLALVTMAAQVSLPVTALITGPVLARVLGPDGRGTYAAVLAPMLVVAFLAHIGLPDATTYAVARLRIPKGHVVATVTRLTVLYSSIATVALWLLAPALLHQSPSAVTLFRVAVLTLPLQMILIILRQTTSGSGDFHWRNLERVSNAILRFIAIVLAAAAGLLTLTSAVWITILAGLVGLPILLVTLFGWRLQRLRFDPKTRVERPHLGKDLALYGLRGWGGVFAYLVNYRLDQALLVVLVAPAQLGFYAVAVSLAELPQTAFMQMKNILFAESAARDSMLLIARACRLLLLITVVLALIGMAVAPFAIPIMFGRDFEPAVRMSQILLAGTVPFLTDSIISAGMLSLGLPGRRSIGSIIGAVVTVVGLVVLCPRYGAIGAAWTSLIAYSTASVIGMVIFSKTTGIRIRDIVIPRREDVVWLMTRLGQLAWRLRRRKPPRHRAAS